MDDTYVLVLSVVFGFIILTMLVAVVYYFATRINRNQITIVNPTNHQITHQKNRSSVAKFVANTDTSVSNE